MKHRLCLDQCDIQPKLIRDGIVLDQHEEHHIEPIEIIQNRLKEPGNKIIVDDILTNSSLNSILAENEVRKQSILKNFTITISQIFYDIERVLTQNWNYKKRIADTLLSLLPEYDQDQMSQIQGDFQFLKQENKGVLQELSIEQTNQIKKVKTQIDDLVLQVDQFLRRYQPAEQPIQLIQQVISGQWEEDGLQEMRVNEANSSQSYFSFTFEKDRGLKIQKQSQKKPTQEDLTKMVCLCLAFKPNNLQIILQFNSFLYRRETGVTDISPLGSIKALLNLTSLEIYLEFFLFDIKAELK